MHGGGVILFAAFLVAGTPAFSAEPVQGSGYATASIPGIAASRADAYLQTIWSTSNQFGSGHAWFVNKPGQSRVAHLTFVGLNGQTLAQTATSDHVQVVSSAGAFDIRVLPNGNLVEHVFVRAGVCDGDPGNVAAVTGKSASIVFTAKGVPVDSSGLANFESARKAFACDNASVTSQMRSFMAAAGLSPPAVLPGTSVNRSIVPVAPAGSGRVHALVSQDCANAELLYAAALAAIVLSVGSLDPFAATVSLIAARQAAKDMEAACGI